MNETLCSISQDLRVSWYPCLRWMLDPHDTGKGRGFRANPSGVTSGTAFPPVGTVLNYSQVFNGTFSLVEHRHTDMINGQKSERSLVNKIL